MAESFAFCTMEKLAFLALLSFSTGVFAQKQDNTWVIGHDYNFDDNHYGRIVLNFATSPPQIDYPVGDVNMNMYITNVSISDSTGHLMFYSNGCNIANANGEIIPNGDEINPGAFQNRLCDVIGRGYGGGYSNAVILPLPENDSTFYMFHESTLYVPPPHEDAYVERLLYTIVKSSTINLKKYYYADSKNTNLIADSLAAGEVNAVKHGNGKDWWIIFPRRNSNQFYVLLFTKDGIVDTLTQTIGDIPPADKEGYGQTVFSPDGTRMIRYFPYAKIMNFRFDRETGIFTNYSTFDVNYGNDIAPQGGCCISPSGQFFYITAAFQVYQFDLWASDISSSQIKVAVWDGYLDPVAILFWFCQLGPDCKIYIEGGGDTRYYHIIHNPDEPGLACNVEQRGLVFSIPSGASIPYFPNYRLGPIDNPGLPCSPVVATQQPAIRVPACEVWPNPAAEQLHFSLPEGQIRRITLTDAYGRAAREVRPGAPTGAYTLPVGDLPAGVYFWTVEGESGVVMPGKVMIDR